MTTGHPVTRNSAGGPPASTNMPKQLFVSYPRANKREVDELVDHLEPMNYKVWADSALHGGQAWWDEILHQIADCDTFIAIVSRATPDSVACKRELEWALKLTKPVLPVAVERVVEAALPKQLAMLEIVDYSTPGVESAFALAGSLARLGPAPPPPEHLPNPPLAPLSYLAEVVDRVAQEEPLTQEEQRRILDQLETALGSADPEEQQAGREIFDRFSKRRDLFADIAGRLGPLRPQIPRPHPWWKRAKIISTIVSTLAIIGAISAVLVLSHPWRQERITSPADRLLGMIPGDYRDICKPGPPPPGSSLADAEAFVRCQQDSNPNVPRNAVFALFSDKTKLKDAWKKAVAPPHDTMQPCPPDGVMSPKTWLHGTVACSIYKDPTQSNKEQAEVEWTDESKQLFGAVWKDLGSSAFDQVYGWWGSDYG